jgi:hypothetical protein
LACAGLSGDMATRVARLTNAYARLRSQWCSGRSDTANASYSFLL